MISILAIVGIVFGQLTTSNDVQQWIQDPAVHQGNYRQMNQMNQLLPLIMLMEKDNDDDTKATSNKEFLAILLASDPTFFKNPRSILPLLLHDDGSTDLPAVFMLMTTMQNQCASSNNFNALLYTLLLKEKQTNTKEVDDSVSDEEESSEEDSEEDSEKDNDATIYGITSTSTMAVKLSEVTWMDELSDVGSVKAVDTAKLVKDALKTPLNDIETTTGMTYDTTSVSFEKDTTKRRRRSGTIATIARLTVIFKNNGPGDDVNDVLSTWMARNIKNALEGAALTTEGRTLGFTLPSDFEISDRITTGDVFDMTIVGEEPDVKEDILIKETTYSFEIDASFVIQSHFDINLLDPSSQTYLEVEAEWEAFLGSVEADAAVAVGKTSNGNSLSFEALDDDTTTKVIVTILWDQKVTGPGQLSDEDLQAENEKSVNEITDVFRALDLNLITVEVVHVSTDVVYEEKVGRRRRAIDSSNILQTLVLFQAMSPGDNKQMNSILPFIILHDDSDDTLFLILMTMMNGQMNTETGFNQGFNMLLPFLLVDCDDKVDDALKSCKKQQRDLLVISLAMQTQNPAGKLDANDILPLVLIDDKNPMPALPEPRPHC